MASVKTQSAPIAIAATGEIIPAVVGKRIIIYNYTVTNSVATAQSVQFASGGTAISGAMALTTAVGGGMSPSASDNTAVLIGLAHSNISITLGASTAVGGHIAFEYVQA